MKQGNQKKWRFAAGLCASLLLILFGMIMVIRVFTQYGQIFMQTQDDYLLHLAQSVDRNICNLLDRYEDGMDYFTSRPDFLDAQEQWKNGGESEALLHRLEDSILNRDELIVAVLVVEQGQVVLSTDGDLHYSFISGGESGILRPCVGKDGDIYLAITHTEEEGIVYAALIDLDLFYDQLAGSAFSDHNWILLTDTHCQVLLYQQQKHAYVDRVDAVTGATSGQEGVEILLNSQKEQTTYTTSYAYFDTVTDETYTARMAVLPSDQSENGAFAVGIVANYETAAAALNYAVLRLMLFGSMLVVGILLLILLMMLTRRKDERELTYLRRKNEQVEALSRKTRELAHHQRLETIGTLTSSIAHEFNNLLTPIMGYSIMVLEKIPPEEEEIYDNLLEIYQASQKAKTIISRLSDLSRKNTGLSYQYISPNELCGRVLEVAAPARPAKVDIRLNANCSEGYLHGNETQLSQLLLNLVLNGFHAMQEKGGILTLSTFADQSRVILRVNDTGDGIAPDVLPHVFEPFFTTKESGKGTGLGLAIVQQVAEEHQGNVKIDTKLGEYTTVTVSLPLHQKPEDPSF